MARIIARNGVCDLLTINGGWRLIYRDKAGVAVNRESLTRTQAAHALRVLRRHPLACR